MGASHPDNVYVADILLGLLMQCQANNKWCHLQYRGGGWAITIGMLTTVDENGNQKTYPNLFDAIIAGRDLLDKQL